MGESQAAEAGAPLAGGVLLEVEGLSKSYGVIRALRDLTLDIRAGEVHGICGHNGAGKSTLVKALVGLVRPDTGVIRIDGREVTFRSPQEAQAHGIAIVDQELSLVPALTVEDNIYLGGLDVPILYRSRALHRRARAILDQLGLAHVQLNTTVERLAIGERQLVEVARLLTRDARLLILDEPTATLSKPEIERVFRAVREVVSQGRSVIFVSHRLDEVFELCDRVTVFRDGERVGTHAIGEIDRPALIRLILGEMEGEEAAALGGALEAEIDAQTRSADAHVSVEIDRLTVPHRVHGFSLSLERGQVVGLAGQVGSGTSEVLRSLGGLVPDAGGSVAVEGRPVRLNTPKHALDGGILYLSNDRAGEGLFLSQSVENNLTVSRLRSISSFGFLRRRRSRQTARNLAELVGVQVTRLTSPVASMSGGNQQKVLLGRGLQRAGTVLLALDEPTRGVDVGGRAEIHRLVRRAASEGNAVLFSSTELDEVLELSDLIVTMFEGRVVSAVPRGKADAASVLADMTMGRSDPPAAVGA